jgi:phosphate transport system substrate-binding protein
MIKNLMKQKLQKMQKHAQSKCANDFTPLLCAGFCILLIAFSFAIAQAQTTNADALSKAREIGTKNRASKKYYTKVFDLNGLHKYEPKEQVSGTIRQWGNNYLQDSGLSQTWEDEFRKYHPNVKFADNLSSSAVAFPGLITSVADLAPMGRQALWDELKG